MAEKKKPGRKPGVPQGPRKGTLSRSPRLPRTPQATLDRLEQNRLVDVVLRFHHSINGVNYGPGRVRVKHSLAIALKGQETKASEEVTRFQGTRTKIIEPISRRQITVSPEGLSEYLGIATSDPYAGLR